MDAERELIDTRPFTTQVVDTDLRIRDTPAWRQEDSGQDQIIWETGIDKERKQAKLRGGT